MDELGVVTMIMTLTLAVKTFLKFRNIFQIWDPECDPGSRSMSVLDM